MKEIMTILTIAVALSMDTFSLSLGIGTGNITKKQCLLFSIIVGTMHFVMPLIGNIVGNKIVEIFMVKSNFLLGIILIYLSITMFLEIIKPNEKPKNMKIISMFLLAISVSIDSFSSGIGLCAITSNLFATIFIFSITSFCFTFIGLLIGKYTNRLLGVYANLFGAILLIVIGIFHLCKY